VRNAAQERKSKGEAVTGMTHQASGAGPAYLLPPPALTSLSHALGFIPAPPADGRSGFGLAGMRERAESLQGSVQIESVPGEGTTLSMTLPMVRPAGGDAAVEVTAS